MAGPRKRWSQFRADLLVRTQCWLSTRTEVVRPKSVGAWGKKTVPSEHTAFNAPVQSRYRSHQRAVTKLGIWKKARRLPRENEAALFLLGILSKTAFRFFPD